MKDNSLRYEEAFVCFIDVLGYREIVKNKEKVKKYYDAICLSIENCKKNYAQFGSFKYHIMSDSIVISVAYARDYQDKIDVLKALLAQVTTIQYFLALADIWIRGGVSFGEIAFTDDNVFVTGEGLVRAYELEQLANYPRIIIDPSICKLLDLTSKDLTLTLNSGEGLNCIFDEGHILNRSSFGQKMDYLFLNFMVVAASGEINEVVKKELDLIYKNLKNSMYSNPKQIHKYQWVRDYIQSTNLIPNIHKL